MAVRQYIGARYVPKYDGDWDATKNYEPLTIVTDANGNSFTSMKDVPAGTALTDRNYWIQTSSFSGAVDTLQRRMNAAEGDISALQGDVSTMQSEVDDLNNLIGNDTIIIADSYGLDDAIPDGESFITILQRTNPQFAYAAIGGTGFASDLYISDNFRTMLQSVAASMTTKERNAVKNIVVIGGANDANLIANGTITDNNVLKSKIVEFSEYALQTFPNARVKACFVGWYRDVSRHTAYNSARDVYQAAAYACKNYAYIASGETIMKNNAHIEKLNLIHPTAKASKELAAFTICVVNGGVYKYAESVDCIVTGASGVTVENLRLLNCTYDDNYASITLIGEYAGKTFTQFRFSTPIVLNYGEAFELAKIDGCPVGGQNPDGVIVECQASAGGGNLRTIPFMIAIQNNTLVGKYVGSDDLSAFNMVLLNVPIITNNMNLRKS